MLGENITTYNGSGDWFQIAVVGYDTPFGSTRTNWRSYDEGTFDVSMPTTMRNGQYLLRIEHIGLHRPSARERFSNCAQVEVTGSSVTAVPSEAAKILGIYSESDE